MLPQWSVEQVVDRILTSRIITRLDQQLLLSYPSLNAAQKSQIDQVFDRLRKGFLKVVD
jgi:hypothetical protein